MSGSNNTKTPCCGWLTQWEGTGSQPKGWFPKAKSASVENQYHQYQMSKRAISALGTANSTNGNRIDKRNRISNNRRMTNGRQVVAKFHPGCCKSNVPGKGSIGRVISISNGGILTPSARAAGTMDRLARLKAPAIGGTKKINY